ncbi:hypothetical protein CWI42_080210 [Ordospora colligata]|uniref:Metalloenzyme domain-containing protein n=1 Tax=Ordospora colligata OC4 TaxID=1354746 RepID=A0A0B2UJT5_9MICR|nr:uncharacterized protein M896_080210 [Ordospora colligata OC4]KHN69287.1 hypothetical protein M896_080210 [Ordospora colligata OC4]TBU15103.1 hypothetical protein CWI41_080220 [Ordospora colligata]TBU15154.1 hypothetical protein CWI40_080220 [Ordospora colligata]TBU18400.1 hypothetical protein CWI42_080210 [Ordospora colligata]
MILNGLAGILNIYMFLTGVFKASEPPSQISTEAVSNSKYTKVIYLLLDGLRFDSTVEVNKEGCIFNKMQHLNSIKTKYHALSVSGMPTETSARVIGLTTGAPSNFLTSIIAIQGTTISKDNMVDQLLRDGKSCVFFGDCQWTKYFPVLKSWPHFTIDPYGRHELRAQENMLIEKIVESVNSYDVMIAHLINLDSYGHIYETIHHERMQNEIEIYDKLIYDIYQKMSSDTLLVVCSDHGVDDNGAHGGVSTLEMASVAIFISKDDRFTNTLPLEGVAKDARKRCISKTYDDEQNVIKSTDSYPIIHQDDILPTMCYLMGIPIPSLSGGNFVHELVSETEAYRKYAQQKYDLLGIPFKVDTSDRDELLHLNYMLSESVLKKLAGRNYTRLGLSVALSIGIAIAMLFKLSKSKFGKLQIALAFVLVMTAHSVFSIIHEDYLWAVLFLISNPSIKNLLGTMMFLQIARPGSSMNAFYVLVVERVKLCPFFNGNWLFIVELLLFAMINNKKHLEVSLEYIYNSVTMVFNKHPQIIISFMKYFLHGSLENAEWRLCLLIQYPCIDSLLALILRPMESVYLIYILRNLDICNNPETYFSLTNMAFFSSGLCKLLQSINYSVFFTFSDRFVTIPAVIIAFYYFMYPRLRAILLIKNNERLKKANENHNNTTFEDLVNVVISFSSINILLVMWSGYAISDSLSFYKFLGVRAFFEYLYYLCDITLFFIFRIIKAKL